MNAVLSVNLKARFVTIGDYFIYARRAVALSGFVVGRKVDLNRNRGVSQLQVAGLIFFMVGIDKKTDDKRSNVSTLSGFG